MTVAQRLMEKVQALSPEAQQQVLEFVESLAGPSHPSPARKDPRGMFSDHGVSITLEDFQEARREAWANFPRPFPDEPDA